MLSAALVLSLSLPAELPPHPSSIAAFPAQPPLLHQGDLLSDLEERFVYELEALAKKCQSAKAFVERNATWELVLLLDPDHAAARKTLGHKKDRKTGEWNVPERSRTPKAAAAEVADPLRAERMAALDEFVSKCITRIDASDLPARTKRRVEDRLLELAPENDSLHERAGEVRDGDKWLLQETVRAKTQRKAHEKLRGDLKTAAPEATEGTVDAAEQTYGVTFGKAWETPLVRVVSAVGEAEAQETAKRAHATYTYLDALLGTEFKQAAGTLYLFEGAEATKTFCNAYPGLEDGQRTLFGGLLCAYLDHHHANSSSKKREERLDGAVRMSIARHLAWTTGTYSKHGWIAEGLGIYVTHQMVGTRLIFQVRDADGSTSKGGQKQEDRMKRADADWLALARTTLEGKNPPKLAFTLGRDVNTLTRGDVLVANALVAYLLEGCEPGTALRVFLKIGREDMSSAQALADELGLDPPALERRLVRWLKELGK